MRQTRNLTLYGRPPHADARGRQSLVDCPDGVALSPQTRNLTDKAAQFAARVPWWFGRLQLHDPHLTRSALGQ